jgi:hypothetical protein
VARKRLLPLIGSVAAVACLGWWLFGWSTHCDGGSCMTMHRFFGRTTWIDSVMVAGDKTLRERLVFSWSEPFLNGDPTTVCAAIFPETWQDWDGDGRWDTWLYRVGPRSGDNCQVEYRVDTKGRGVPDWVFTVPYGEYKKAKQMMVDRRGF